MLFEKLVINNFGIYKGRHEVELAPKSKKKPIILFGALNGGGKTTFLDSILLALYGKFAKCSNRGVLGYQEYLGQTIQKDTDPRIGASVELQFVHDREGSQDRIRVIRSWLSTGKNIKETVEVYLNGEFDSFITERWYEYVEEFIPLQISSLFFFDGERIESLASSNKSRELIRTGLYALLGLDVIERLTQDLVTIEKKQIIKTKNKQEKVLIEELSQQIESFKNDRSDISQQLASTRNKIQQIDNTIDSLQKEYKNQGGDLFDKQEAIEAEKKVVEKDLDEVKTTLKDLASGIAPLVLVKDLLDRASKQSKKEQEAKRQIQLKSELLKRDRAIIAFLKKSDSNTEVISSLDDFLKNDRKQKSDAGKLDIYLNVNPEVFSCVSVEAQTDLQNRIQRAVTLSNFKQQELESIDFKIAAVPDKGTLKKITGKLSNVRDEKSNAQATILFLEKEYERVDRIISDKESKYLKMLEADTDQTYADISNERILKHSKKLRDTFSEFQRRAIGSQLKKLEKLILESYTTIMNKDDLITNVRIDPDTFQLSLIDKSQKLLSPERLSAGERQLLVISILWSLSKASGNVLPSVIDTPLGRLDGKHRQLLVENYFPNAGQQVILLSTDEEIDNRHFQRLKKNISHSYLINYEKSKSSSVINKGYFW